MKNAARDIKALVGQLSQIKDDEKAVERVMGLAIKLEQSCEGAMASAAKAAKDPKGKEMFEFLAKDEHNHVSLLKKELAAIREDPDWIEKEPVSAPIATCLGATPKKLTSDAKKLAAGRGIKADADDLSALGAAIKLKESSLDFYCNAAAVVAGPAAKKLLAHLMDLEKRHLNELEVQYAWLDQAGFWYDASMMTD